MSVSANNKKIFPNVPSHQIRQIVRSRTFQIVSGILGTAGSLYFLIRLAPLRTLTFPPTNLFILLAFVTVIQLFARAERLKRICQIVGNKISIRQSFRIHAIGDFFGAITPSGLGGDVSRGSALASLPGITASHAITSLATDGFLRLVTLGLLVVLSIGVILLQNPAQIFPSSLVTTLSIYLFGAILFLVIIILIVRHKKINTNWRLLLSRDLFFLALLYHIIRIGVLPLMVLLIAPEKMTAMVFVSSFVLNYGLTLLPIPSGGGSIEVAFMALMGPLLGKPEAAVAMVWWRFTNYYFYVLNGVVTVLWGSLRMASRLKEPAITP